MNRNLILIFFAILMPLAMRAQSPVEVRNLSLENCIRLAQGQSPEASIAEKSYLGMYWNYKSYRAGLLPQVRLDANSPGILRTISQITQPDGTQTFLQQNQAYSNANLSISQVIAPTGGQLFLSTALNRLDVFGGNGYQQYQATPLLLSLRQPLFSYNAQRWEKQIQPLQLKLAENRYLEALEEIAMSISGKYFDVYIAQIRLENAQSNEKNNDSIYTVSKGRFNVGKIAENDLLQTELAYLNARSDVRQAELDLAKAKTDLAISLGFSNDENIVLIPPMDVPEVMVDIDFALQQARENRSDLVDFQVRELQAESDLARARAGSRFNADINASFGLNQTGNTLSEAYNKPLDQQTASIGFGIPILQWGRGKAAVESAIIDQQRVNEQIKLEKRRLERDVRFQVLDFMQLQDQVTLAAKADTIASRRFEVAKKRYLIGKIDITNLQIAQNEKDAARSNYIQVLRQYWTAYYALRRSTLYDFIKGQRLSPPRSLIKQVPGID